MEQLLVSFDESLQVLYQREVVLCQIVLVILFFETFLVLFKRHVFFLVRPWASHLFDDLTILINLCESFYMSAKLRTFIASRQLGLLREAWRAFTRSTQGARTSIGTLPHLLSNQNLIVLHLSHKLSLLRVRSEWIIAEIDDSELTILSQELCYL